MRGRQVLRGKRCFLLIALFWLGLAVNPSDIRANPSSTSLATSGLPATAASTPVLKLLGRWHGGPIYSSAVSGDLVYFGMGGVIRALKIEHGTGQETPSWKEMASIAASGVVRGLDASGSYLYVADGRGALRIIDISVPEKPKETGHVEFPANFYAVSVGGQYAYVASGWRDLSSSMSRIPSNLGWHISTRRLAPSLTFT